MRGSGRWIGVAAAVGIISALVPVVQGRLEVKDLPLARLGTTTKLEGPPPLEGLDLLDMTLTPRRVTAPLSENRTAELTVDAEVQRISKAMMQRYRIPEAGAVLLEVKTGRVLAYASHIADGKPFDVNARAEAPAASVFKVVTGAALVEGAGLNATSEQCYHGGRSQISPSELVADPKKDKWCTSLGNAMGRSINVVFGRLAQKHLTPESLEAMGGALGFGGPLPFAVPNEAPTIDIPVEPLEFARAAAGFWHSTLSPLAAASMAQAIANGGTVLEPRIVEKVLRGKETLWAEERPPKILRRAIRPETAAELRRMMVHTVQSGSGHRGFHDANGEPYLPGIAVAGKTGTLTKHEANRHYTWFVGFAPAEQPEVAVSALVVNTEEWRIKGTDLARDVLRAYFVGQRRQGVTRP